MRSSEPRALVLSRTIGRRYLRARVGMAAAVVVLACTGVLMAAAVFLQGQSLTGDQTAARDLGRFEAMVGYGAREVLPGSALASDLERRLDEASVGDRAVAMVAQEFPIPQLGFEGTFYKELDWSNDPFPGRYRIELGRFPMAAGEIALADTELPDGVEVGSTLTVLGGALRLTVVGVLDDDFSSNRAVLAGPGTWARIPAEVATGNELLAATPIVYWSGSEPEVVLPVVTETLRASTPKPGAGPPVGAAVTDSFVLRADIEAHDEKSWIAKSPAASLIPSLMVPPLATALAFGIALRRAGPGIRRMTAIGIPARPAALGPWMAVAAWCVVAVLGGLAAGQVLGYWASRWVAHLADETTPLWRVPWGTVLRLVLASAVGILAGLVLFRSAGLPTRTDSASLRSTKWRDSRHVLAVLAACAALLLLLGMDSPQRAMYFTAAVAAAVLGLAADVVPWLLRRLPEGGLLSRLTKRQLVAESGRATTVVVTLAMALGLTLAFLTLLSTMITTAGASTYPAVHPGQVMLADRITDTRPVSAATRRAALSVPALRQQAPVRLRFAGEARGDFLTRLQAGESIGLVLVASDTAELGRLLGGTVPTAQQRVLESGGILVWDESAGAIGDNIALRVMREDRTLRDLGSVPALMIQVPRVGWAIGTAGVVLNATAAELDVPAPAGAEIYTGLSDDTDGAVLHAVAAAGLDPETVRVYAPPPPPVPPVALYGTAAALALLVLTVSIAATRSQVASLRARLGHLLALGIPSRWARQVILRQQFVLLGLAVAFGLTIALPPVLLASSMVSGFVLSVPSWQLVVVVAAFLVANLAAAVWATGRLRASER